MNRFLRRLSRFGKRRAHGRGKGPTTPTDGRVLSADTPQDVSSTRPQRSRHKTVTADRWNQ